MGVLRIHSSFSLSETGIDDTGPIVMAGASPKNICFLQMGCYVRFTNATDAQIIELIEGNVPLESLIVDYSTDFTGFKPSDWKTL